MDECPILAAQWRRHFGLRALMAEATLLYIRLPLTR